jgi:hypothetical protein
MSNWADFMQNPKGVVLKKFMYPLLQDKIANYDDLLTRIGHSLVTENDLKAFSDMVNDIIAAGYKKAVFDYQQQLKKMGIEVNITQN